MFRVMPTWNTTVFTTLPDSDACLPWMQAWNPLTGYATFHHPQQLLANQCPLRWGRPPLLVGWSSSGLLPYAYPSSRIWVLQITSGVHWATDCHHTSSILTKKMSSLIFILVQMRYLYAQVELFQRTNAQNNAYTESHVLLVSHSGWAY